MPYPLRAYQRQGVHFLLSRDQAMLCDATGLGKSAIAATTCQEGQFTTLLVCPKSIRDEWKQEIEKWTTLKAIIIDGPPKTRWFLYRLKSDIYIISYDTILRDSELVSRVPYNCIILDEAQRIRNCNTLTAQIIKNIRLPKKRYLLTATPIENRMGDLYSLIEFIGNGVYGDLQRELLKNKGSFTGYFNTTWGEGSKRLRKMVARANPATIAGALSQFMLRRRKEDVALELPPKTNIRIKLPLTPEQNREYELARDEFLRIVDDVTIPIPNTLSLITHLRVICDSTRMSDPSSGSSSKINELIPRIKDILENEQKIIIFSEFRRMCDKIIYTLQQNDISDISYMHGEKCNTSIEKKAFWDKNRIMVATRTGETGHNLQCASYIFEMEPCYNPARITQRENRVHRLGQTNPVFIYDFISPGTIEEHLLDILQTKQELFKKVIDRPEYREWLRGLVE